MIIYVKVAKERMKVWIMILVKKIQCIQVTKVAKERIKVWVMILVKKIQCIQVTKVAKERMKIWIMILVKKIQRIQVTKFRFSFLTAKKHVEFLKKSLQIYFKIPAKLT